MEHYQKLHTLAMSQTTIESRQNNAHEACIVALYQAWRSYAVAHRAAYEASIGDDCVLGEHWQEIGHAIIGLLNGETGRLDCGSLDRDIRQTLTDNDCSAEK